MGGILKTKQKSSPKIDRSFGKP